MLNSYENIVKAIKQPIYEYYAFEPVKEFYDQISTSYEGIENLIRYNAGLHKKNTKMSICYDEEIPSGSHLTDTVLNEGISTVKIDDIVEFGDFDYWIKMDIEGFELDALKGATNLIQAKRPNLAICLYHKTRDVFEIPYWVDSLNLGYRFHIAGGGHTIMLASAD